MSITINTSKKTKTKKANIDGIDFEVRPLSSAESISLTSIGKKLSELKDTTNVNESVELLEEFGDIIIGLFDKEEEIKKILRPLPFESWIEIYNQIMNGESDG